jgi:fermentation-respiration switch protein FrsA (DUF1100 family)
MKRATRLLIVAVVFIYGALVLLALFSDHLIFQPPPLSYSDNDLSGARLDGVRSVHLASGDQRISAVFLPNSEAKYTLLFSHGNAEDIGNDLPMLGLYREAGFSVFAYDYRGYGTSTGRPSEKGVYEDAIAAYNYLTDQLHVPPERVIAMGRSVGCAPAIYVAAHRKVAGLVAEAPFITAFRVMTHFPLLPWDKFNNLREIRNVHAPVLIFHGRNDQVIPFWHGERVFSNANEPKQFVAVEGAGHNNVLMVSGRKYLEDMTRFASSLNN